MYFYADILSCAINGVLFNIVVINKVLFLSTNDILYTTVNYDSCYLDNNFEVDISEIHVYYFSMDNLVIDIVHSYNFYIDSVWNFFCYKKTNGLSTVYSVV